MARITVEDCLQKLDNRFQLVLVATKRARQLTLGQAPLVDDDGDKPTVIALREIAAGLVTEDLLKEPAEPTPQELLEASFSTPGSAAQDEAGEQGEQGEDTEAAAAAGDEPIEASTDESSAGEPDEDEASAESDGAGEDEAPDADSDTEEPAS